MGSFGTGEIALKSDMVESLATREIWKEICFKIEEALIWRHLRRQNFSKHLQTAPIQAIFQSFCGFFFSLSTRGGK